MKFCCLDVKTTAENPDRALQIHSSKSFSLSGLDITPVRFKSDSHHASDQLLEQTKVTMELSR
jgi:hypothetical protein